MICKAMRYSPMGPSIFLKPHPLIVGWEARPALVRDRVLADVAIEEIGAYAPDDPAADARDEEAAGVAVLAAITDDIILLYFP